jgi:hypothetical protein
VRETRLGFSARVRILPVLLILSSGCQGIHGWGTDEVAAYADGPLLEKVEQLVSETAGNEFREWREAADADRDGDTTWAEWFSFIFGSSGGVALTWWLVRRLIERRRAPRETDEGPEPEVVLPGARQPQGAGPRPWYEVPIATAPAATGAPSAKRA